MKKLLLAAVLGLACTAAQADWTPWFTAATGDQFFLDKSTVTRSGNIVSFWMRNDFVNPMPIGQDLFMYSNKVLAEVNCTTMQWRRTKAVSYYAPHAGGTPGPEVATPTPWSQVPAKSGLGMSIPPLCSSAK